MLRNIAAVIAGLVVGTIVNFALLRLNIVFFPLPDGVDMTDTAQMRDAIRGMAAAAWVLVFAAHLGQAFVGGWVAARLGASRPMMLAMIVGVLSLAGGVANAVMLAAPYEEYLKENGYTPRVTDRYVGTNPGCQSQEMAAWDRSNRTSSSGSLPDTGTDQMARSSPLVL